MDLKGRTAIVTGGSKGYGYGIAKALKAKGAEVWITGRREKELAEAAGRLGVSFVAGDVACGSDWDRLFKTVVDAKGSLDLLVNNAGAGIGLDHLRETSDEAIELSIRTNLVGPLLGCRRAAALMVSRKSGMIINISSVCAIHAWPGFAAYSAAKAGLNMLGHVLHTELRPFGVRVATLTPSWGDTDFGVAMGHERRGADDRAKCMSPDEMGDLVVSIASLPEHLTMPDVRVQPMVQEIIPF